MPNQRSKNKRYLGGFMERELHAEIIRMAKEAGMGDNKFGFVTQLLEKLVKRRRRRPRPPLRRPQKANRLRIRPGRRARVVRK